MTSPVRPIVVTILLAIACSGRVPAWLHFSHCDHRGLVKLTAVEVYGECASGCCGHPVSNNEATEPSEALPEPYSQRSHGHNHDDSESCAICHVLSAPNGVAWHIEFVAIGHLCVENARIVYPLAPELPAFSIPQSRGPPALLG